MGQVFSPGVGGKSYSSEGEVTYSTVTEVQRGESDCPASVGGIIPCSLPISTVGQHTCALPGNRGSRSVLSKTTVNPVLVILEIIFPPAPPSHPGEPCREALAKDGSPRGPALTLLAGIFFGGVGKDLRHRISQGSGRKQMALSNSVI